MATVAGACGSTSNTPVGASSGGSGSSALTGGVAGAPVNSGGVPENGSGGVAGVGAGGTPVTGGSGAASATGGVGAMGGSAGAGGIPTSGSGGAGSAGSAGAQAEACPEVPVARRSSGTVLEIPLHLVLQGKPLLFAESNPLENGGTLTPLDIRFYVSEVALLPAAGEPVPVDVITAAGTPATYGVHLYSAEDSASNVLRVLAPVGDFTGIQFLLGLSMACNQRQAESSKAPLSATSQMSWPHTGFLFLRYQGRTTPPGSPPSTGGTGGAESMDPATPFPSVIHMGGNLFQDLAPLVRVDGALSVPASGPARKGMNLVLDEVFKGALTDVDLSGFVGPPGEEVVLGERLRRSMSGLHLFAFEP